MTGKEDTLTASDYTGLGLPDSTLMKSGSGTVDVINSDTQIEDSSIEPIKLVDNISFFDQTTYSATQTVNSNGGWNAISPTLNFTLTRTSKVLITYALNAQLIWDTTAPEITGTCSFALIIDGQQSSADPNAIFFATTGDVRDYTPGITSNAGRIFPVTRTAIKEFSPGNHTIQIRVYPSTHYNVSIDSAIIIYQVAAK